MDSYFAGWPKVTAVGVEAVRPGGAQTATAVAVVTAGGEERRIVLAVTTGKGAWLVDWPKTRGLWE
jgi:hypothetical protein